MESKKTGMSEGQACQTDKEANEKTDGETDMAKYVMKKRVSQTRTNL